MGRNPHNVRMKIITALFSLIACLFLIACSDEPQEGLIQSERILVPAAAPARGPRLSGDDVLGLYLTWMEPGEKDTALRYASFRGHAWSDAATIARVEQMFVNWADMPMLLPLGAGRLVAHWLQKSADLTYAYDVVVVQTADDGATWSEPMRPHSDGTPTEHGFVSMYAHGDGAGLIWLDGRKMVNEATADPASNGMTLRGASIAPDSTLNDEQLIDELTCDCCQTDVAIAATGPVAVYRDRTAEEIRDISVTRNIDGQWQTGTRIATDNWEIPGCPVNGPAIDADGETVAVAWFTAAAERPVVRMAWSSDSGKTFTTPIDVTASNTKGRVGLALLNGRAAAVSWLGLDEHGKHRVEVRTVRPDGTLGPVITIAEDATALAVPQLARYGDDLLLVWTAKQGADDSIVSARVPIASL